ncbi:MAG: hypothetical protein ACU0BS_08180 [Hasllibacter sp.]
MTPVHARALLRALESLPPSRRQGDPLRWFLLASGLGLAAIAVLCALA